MRLWWTTENDLMVGSDVHNEITATIPPLAWPDCFHLVGAKMHWYFNDGEFEGKTVVIQDQLHCHHMQDIKLGIPHIPLPPWPPCALALVLIATSKSKIILGAFTVIADDKVAGLMGLQLHCNEPIQFPTGTQIPSRWPTVWCGFSWLDILASIILAAFDVLLAWCIDWLVHKIPFVGKPAKGFGHSFLEEYWIKTGAKELLESAAPMFKVMGREFLKHSAERGPELGVDKGLEHFGVTEAIDEFFSDTIAEWNPHATPERIAAAADRSVPYFADWIYENVMGDRGPMRALQAATGELIGDGEAAKAIEEARASMPPESWRQMFAQGFGQDFRDAMARYFEDRCEKMNAEETGLSGPRQA